MKKLSKFWRKNAPEAYFLTTMGALFAGEPYVAFVTLLLTAGTMIRREEYGGGSREQ